ncbi:MAG: DNA polymerase III subunit gamma/tau [Streptococcaceae bacterium]|jgi:DNA polymerase-3 subunit gamma/tau|nr:DNA polymerase III subunit gamma/tau [Streptococcaceae bacterium]
MNYQALYRTFRSQRFDEIIGQKAISITLKQAILQGKASHAYLFTGPRGTGKTSVARIFAKALNCHHLQDGEPCNQCEMCIAITEDRLEDVLEIDAASNNGVDEIRNLRDTVKYSPVLADYKIYIIDEVHMLSTNAFNALLKILEEPPANVVFILATTEVHKVLPTIISRTQRFNFKRIGIKDIVYHLKDILQKLKIKFEEKALYTIARVAEGSMRDALSILDQAISFTEDTLTSEDTMMITGSLTRDMMDRYMLAVYEKNVEKSLKVLGTILEQGKEAKRFLEDMILYNRDLLMYRYAAQLVTEIRGVLTDTFKQLSIKLCSEDIYTYIKLLNEAQQEIRLSNLTNVYLEVVTVKLATSSQASSIIKTWENDHKGLESLREELSQLQNIVKNLQKGKDIFSENRLVNNNSSKSKADYKNPVAQIHQVLLSATKTHLTTLKKVWPDLLNSLDARCKAMMKASEPVAANDGQMVVAYDYDILAIKASKDETLKQVVRNNLNKMIGFAPDLVIVTNSQWPKLRRAFIKENRKKLQLDKVDMTQNIVAKDYKSFNKDADIIDKAVNLFGKDMVKVR